MPLTDARERPTSDKLLTPIEIGLTAAIVAIEGNEPMILTASASATMRGLGVAVGEARRSACAIATSARAGLSTQAATKAPAVERLMPA